jgi:hypothetical protein
MPSACQIIPLPNHEVAFLIDGTRRMHWHYGLQYPRPFFFPLIGPSGHSLTRMGHPGAPDHDHHRSIWFAHEKVLGVNFWGDRTDARIRQKSWLCYQDGDAEAIMAVSLGWYDGHDPKELVEQELIAAVRPGGQGETFVELQATFKPAAESLELRKTNFGFLAVRVAKEISAYFGGGKITDSEGHIGEPAIFGQRASWVDYSGEIAPRLNEGITYFDHRSNPGFPNHWHVREDGWMGNSTCFSGPITITRKNPLILRYLLHAHAGAVDPEAARKAMQAFHATTRFEVVRSQRQHTQFEVRRARA